MKKTAIALMLLLAVLWACGGDDDDKLPPVISDLDISASPSDCQYFRRGEKIPFNYVFTDDNELGKYNIEIHNNFDHHTHSTSSAECEMEANKAPVNPWVYNRDFDIPAGQKRYNPVFDIPIPEDIDPGDYHFMVRLTDHAGWQQLKAMSIKIVE